MAAAFCDMLRVTRNLTPSDWRLYDGRKLITVEGCVMHCKFEINAFTGRHWRENKAGLHSDVF